MESEKDDHRLNPAIDSICSSSFSSSGIANICLSYVTIHDLLTALIFDSPPPSLSLSLPLSFILSFSLFHSLPLPFRVQEDLRDVSVAKLTAAQRLALVERIIRSYSFLQPQRKLFQQLVFEGCNSFRRESNVSFLLTLYSTGFVQSQIRTGTKAQETRLLKPALYRADCEVQSTVGLALGQNILQKTFLDSTALKEKR